MIFYLASHNASIWHFTEDEDAEGGGGKEEESEKEEAPVAIPMIGDTKTGPLSLIAGQDSHKREPVKKTRVREICSMVTFEIPISFIPIIKFAFLHTK